MPKFSPGDMRQQITVQTESRTSDGGGGYAQTWTDSFTAWATVRPISGNERYNHGQLQDTQIYEFVLRYDSTRTFTPANRVKLGTRTFQVRSVINHEERDKYWVARADERVAE